MSDFSVPEMNNFISSLTSVVTPATLQTSLNSNIAVYQLSSCSLSFVLYVSIELAINNLLVEHENCYTQQGIHYNTANFMMDYGNLTYK